MFMPIRSACLLFGVLIGAFASTANADILYSSAMTAPPFTAGNLVGQDGWAAHSGAGALPVQVGAAGTSLVHGSGSREDVNRSIAAISAGQTYYFGLDVVVNGSSDTVYFAHFRDIATDFTTRVFVTAPTGAGDFTFGLSPAGAAPEATWASDFSFGSTNRIIGSYTEGTNEVRLWVNATDITDPFLTLTDAAANAVSSFALRQSTGNSTQLVTNLVVATSFGEAAIPEPATAGLMGLVVVAGTMFRRRR